MTGKNDPVRHPRDHKPQKLKVIYEYVPGPDSEMALLKAVAFMFGRRLPSTLDEVLAARRKAEPPRPATGEK